MKTDLEQGLSEEKYMWLSSALKFAHEGINVFDYALKHTKESAEKVGIPLAKAVEDYIRAVYLEMGLPLSIDKHLRAAERLADYRLGWNYELAIAREDAFESGSPEQITKVLLSYPKCYIRSLKRWVRDLSLDS